MTKHAILTNNGEIVIVSCMEMLLWLEKADRTVKVTAIASGIEVSTKFKGSNYGSRGGVDLWFGTFVFGGPCDGEYSDYSTREEAMAGHEIIVSMVKKILHIWRSGKLELSKLKWKNNE